MNHDIPLGKKVDYSFLYDPGLLCPIARDPGRAADSSDAYAGSWHGEDIWNIYELSWLTPSGRPEVAMAEVRVPAASPKLIESKSLKLYCNSFNMSTFASHEAVAEAMRRDLGAATGSGVRVEMIEAKRFGAISLEEPSGSCIDQLEISGVPAAPDRRLLAVGPGYRQETLFTRLFRSCCPVTGQPDWATIEIHYAGRPLESAALLSYLVSFRQHAGFHEACVERIYTDLMAVCRPDRLTVAARFTRRGGIDINPVRSSQPGPWPNRRDPRQ